MVKIYVSNVSANCFHRSLSADEQKDSLFFPEVCNGKPLTPAELIESLPHIFMARKSIFTVSEHLILYVLMCIRKTTDNEVTPLHLTPDDVEIIYVHNNGWRKMRVDERGEFIDRWPNGFFREREPLLF